MSLINFEANVTSNSDEYGERIGDNLSRKMKSPSPSFQCVKTELDNPLDSYERNSFSYDSENIESKFPDDEDSKSFQEQYIEGERIWKRENFSQSFSAHCDKKELIKDTFTEDTQDLPSEKSNRAPCHLCKHTNRNISSNGQTNKCDISENSSGFDHSLSIVNLKMDKNETEKYKENIPSNSHKCHSCETTFSQKINLKHHIASVHQNLKKYKCQFCEYAATQKANLNTHIKGVHMKLKDFKCHLCEYASSKKSMLVVHVNQVHLKIKNYKCHLCEYTSYRASQLKEHIENVHLKLKNYKCHLCEHASQRKSELKFHIERVHLKLKGHFKCQLCGYVARRKYHLKLHINGVHLQVKHFKCHICDYKATQNTDLRRHLNRVHLKLKKNE